MLSRKQKVSKGNDGKQRASDENDKAQKTSKSDDEGPDIFNMRQQPHNFQLRPKSNVKVKQQENHDKRDNRRRDLLTATSSFLRRRLLRYLYITILVHMLACTTVFLFAWPADCELENDQIPKNSTAIKSDVNQFNSTQIAQIAQQATLHMHTIETTLDHNSLTFHTIFCQSFHFADHFLDLHERNHVTASLEHFVEYHKKSGTTETSNCPPPSSSSSGDPFRPVEPSKLTPDAARELSRALDQVLKFTHQLSTSSRRIASDFSALKSNSSLPSIQREVLSKSSFLWLRWFAVSDALNDGTCSLRLRLPLLPRAAQPTLPRRDPLGLLPALRAPLRVASSLLPLPSRAEHEREMIERIVRLVDETGPAYRRLKALRALGGRCEEVVEGCRRVAGGALVGSGPWFSRWLSEDGGDLAAQFLGGLGESLDSACGLLTTELAVVALSEEVDSRARDERGQMGTYEGVFAGWFGIVVELKRARTRLEKRYGGGRSLRLQGTLENLIEMARRDGRAE